MSGMKSVKRFFLGWLAVVLRDDDDDDDSEYAQL